MKIIDILKKKRTLSFEFYPPRNREGMPAVFRAIDRLGKFRPDFVSVTYGAGGSTQRMTEEIVTRVKSDTELLPMAHLTCVGQTREEIHQVLRGLEGSGIRNVIALRGDPPRGQAEFAPVAGGFAHSTELIEHIRERFSFGIAAACYPEGHQESASVEADLEFTKRKLEAGAEFLITQLFYDNEYMYSFMDKVKQAGITAPVLAGALPILNTEQIRRFTALCGATLPKAVNARLDSLGDDRDSVRAYGIELATTQVAELLRWGVEGIHFYALNRSHSISRILGNLGPVEGWG